MGRLDGETVIVTGGSRGLGASMVRRFAREGANVTLTARDEEQLRSVAESADGETLVAPADVTDDRAVADVVSATIDEFGELTGLVNNAAIGLLSLHDELQPVAEIDVEDWRRIIDVNVNGVFYFSKFAVPEMERAGGGNVINVSSGLGRRGQAGWSPYVSSKWAVEGFTRTLAYELEPEINVNCLDPGGRVATGFWDHLPDEEKAQILEPDVMDEAATRLLAQGDSGITAESLTADEWEQRLP
ncbi:MAG: SDR family NAD(P)-dependent oxidoreductase [Natronomonas sp.]